MSASTHADGGTRPRVPGFLGIDPGLSGAIALYRPGLTGADEGLRLLVWPMPVVAKSGYPGQPGGSRQKNRRMVAPEGVLSSLRVAAGACSSLFCVVEDVHSSPQMGVAGAFSFGQGVGILHACLAALEIPFATVSPQKWKTSTRCPKEKDLARLRASEVFPYAHHYWTRKGDDGMAEAALLAWYAERSA